MSRKFAATGAASSIEIIVEDGGWRTLAQDLRGQIRRAARLAISRGHKSTAPISELTILLTSDERLRTLNRQYRGKDKATNVLSFRGADGAYLGDIAIGYGVTVNEAESAGIPALDHVLHLVTHGVLHLLGYDHEVPKEAGAMESLETDILARMGTPDPYKRRDRAPR